MLKYEMGIGSSRNGEVAVFDGLSDSGNVWRLDE